MTRKLNSSVIDNATSNTQQTISIDLIKVDENKRMRAKRDITPLKDSIETLGVVLNPITIDSDNNLITGYHRYLACKELGKSEIPVRIIDKKVNKELAEIDENLIRSNLSALETAQQILKRKEIYETLYPESKAENIKRNNFASVYVGKSFTKDLSEKTNKSQRWAENYVSIAKKLSNESVSKIKGTDIENNFIILKNISSKPENEQVQAIEDYLNNKSNSKQPKPLKTAYKVDFVLHRVVVGNKWVQLPENYDILNKSYNQMVEDINNPSNN